MLCDLCSFDAAFYGQRLRLFEGTACCQGCYLDLHGVHPNTNLDASSTILYSQEWNRLPTIRLAPLDPSLPNIQH